ncbi:MAG TPA: hypothetical protein VGN78_16455 [Solirubrobacteraceae bacterium]|nr:hypothetical protein [Solirubrobacteraceae bacterium]
MTERRDVQSSLADMDRKLRELQRELAMVSRGPEETAASPPAPEPPAPAASSAAPEPPPPPTIPTSPPPPPAAPPGAPEASADAEAQAQAIVADARAEAARIVDQAAARVAAIGEQIDELQRLRDDLQRSARALVDEYERALSRGAGDGADPAAPPTLQEQAGAFPPPAADPAPVTEGPPPGGGGRLFEGQIVVNAGPFTDIATLGDFEQALARLPQAEDVYVRGFEGNRALIDVKLTGPVALVDEMRRGLSFEFGLVDVGQGRITIDVELRR